MSLSIDDVEVMIQELKEAQELMFQAYEKLETVANQDKRRGRYYETYINDHFRIMIDEQNGFATMDPNLDEWIKELTERLKELE